MKRGLLFTAFFALMFVSFIFDREILEFFNYLNLILPFAVFSFMYYISHVMFFITIVLISAYLLRDRKKILYFLLGVGTSYLASLVLKFLVQRVRPMGAELITGSSDIFSFPSSHATVYFFIFAFMLDNFQKPKSGLKSWLKPDYWQGVAFLIITVLVSLSRVYLGVHYLSDVIGGWLLGVGGYLALKKWIIKT